MIPNRFGETYHDVKIYGHKFSVQDFFWIMDANDDKAGVAYSQVGVFNARVTDIPRYTDITTNMIIILRNQSDYSNVIFLNGSFSIHSLIGDMKPEQMLLRLSEYLYDKCKEYSEETNLKGKDGNDFQMPSFRYSEFHFRNLAIE